MPKTKNNRTSRLAMVGVGLASVAAAYYFLGPQGKKHINTVSAKYKKGLKSSKEEITALAQDLKKHWAKINSEQGQ